MTDKAAYPGPELTYPYTGPELYPAYTLGNTSSYDRAILNGEPICKKIGWRAVGSTDCPEGYLGGWVWHTPEAALAFKNEHGYDHYSVYVLGLDPTFGTGWHSNVDADPDPEDGVHRLIHDAAIIKKYIF